MRAAAKVYDVPFSTLHGRMKSVPYTGDYISLGRKVKETEEDVVVGSILGSPSCGQPYHHFGQFRSVLQLSGCLAPVHGASFGPRP